MTVSAASALNVTGTDTDARDYTTASWTPTVGKVYSVAFVQLDLGGSRTTPTISGNNITWVGGSGNETGGLSTEPAIIVWTGYADSSATAGAITFSGCVSSGQTADGAIWGIAELSNVSANATSAIVQRVATQTPNDTITSTLAAFGSTNNATASWVVSYDNASTTGPAITAGTGFAITTGLNASQAMGGDGVRLAFQFRNTNDTSVDATAAAANDRMLQVAFEIRDLVTSSRSATIAGDGQFVATAFRKQFRSATIAGDGQFNATAFRKQFRSAAIAGDGQFNATAFRNQSRSASVAGNGDWAATAFVVRSRSASIAGNGAWDASAYANRVATVAVAGNGSWAASAVATRFCSVTISGNGSWQASAFLAGTAACSIVGAGEWAASATCTRFVQVSVAGSGVWTVAAFAVRSRQAAISGNGSWLGSGFVTRFVSCNVVGSGVWAAVCSGGRIGEQQRFGGTPQSRRELDRLTADARLAAILQDDEEVLLCLLT